MNTSDDATKDCVQCAQCCNSPMLGMCLKSYTLFRSHLSQSFVREFLYQEVFSLHIGTILWLPNMHNVPHDADFDLQDLLQSQNLETVPISIV